MSFASIAQLTETERKLIASAGKTPRSVQFKRGNYHVERYCAVLGIDPLETLLLVKASYTSYVGAGVVVGLYGLRVGEWQAFHLVCRPDLRPFQTQTVGEQYIVSVPDTLLLTSVRVPEKVRHDTH